MIKRLLLISLFSLVVLAGCSNDIRNYQNRINKAEFEYGVISGAVIMAELERGKSSHHYWRLPTKKLKAQYLIRKAYMERGRPNEKTITINDYR